MKLFMIFICSCPFFLASQGGLDPRPILAYNSKNEGTWYVQRTNCAPKNHKKLRCMKLNYQRENPKKPNLVTLEVTMTIEDRSSKTKRSKESIKFDYKGIGILNPVNPGKGSTRLNFPQHILEYRNNSYASLTDWKSKDGECLWVLTRARLEDRKSIDAFVNKTLPRFQLRGYEDIDQSSCDIPSFEYQKLEEDTD